MGWTHDQAKLSSILWLALFLAFKRSILHHRLNKQINNRSSADFTYQIIQWLTSIHLSKVRFTPHLRRSRPGKTLSEARKIIHSIREHPLFHVSDFLNTVYRYTDNGGSILGISSGDFAVLAGDTRSTSGYSINTRHDPKVFRIGLEGRIVLAVVGFAADGKELKERLDTMCDMYQYKHGKSISVTACAHRLSTLLYSKRFFPFQVQAILMGLDEDGKGALYSYDPAGSYKRDECAAAGAAASLIMPFLDNQVSFNNQYGMGKGDESMQSDPRPNELLSRDTVIDLVKDAFANATERHIEVGDGLQLMLLSKEGIQEVFTPLKRD